MPSDLREKYFFAVVFGPILATRHDLEPVLTECLASQNPELVLDACLTVGCLADPAFTPYVFARLRDVQSEKMFAGPGPDVFASPPRLRPLRLRGSQMFAGPGPDVFAREGPSLAVSTYATFGGLAQVDSSQAMALVEKELVKELRTDAPLAGWVLRVLDCFSSDSQEALVERLWPSVHAEEQRSQLASKLLVPYEPHDGGNLRRERPRAAGTTAFLAKHFHELNASKRGDALSLFGNTLYEPALPVIGEALRDPDSGVRLRASDVFGWFKSQRATEAEFAAWQEGTAESQAKTIADLEKLLDSHDPYVTLAAVKSLGALKARSALPKLAATLDFDSNRGRGLPANSEEEKKWEADMRKAVDDAIARITGQP
jgi:HEAT repeats